MTADAIRNVKETCRRLRQTLLESQVPRTGAWTGALSTSALSTATAVCALSASDAGRHEAVIASGLDWLARHVNDDGAWGDTVKSQSNISTTILCKAALQYAGKGGGQWRSILQQADQWLVWEAGGTGPEHLVKAINLRYGKDRTFSVPILTMAAMAGLLGEGSLAWQAIKPLPFELAILPPRLFAWLRLPVVSYALPALISMGLARFVNAPPGNPLSRITRKLCRRPALKVLSKIQPNNGGFLEAVPLTSFVAMSLCAAGLAQHSAVSRGIEFILASRRSDGSWPIDTNLATWVTTLAVKGMTENASNETGQAGPSDWQPEKIIAWLLDQQYKQRHPYTQAAPGGWAWTDLPGGVPDADDTAGALIALHRLQSHAQDKASLMRAVEQGMAWLMGLQNADGGIPTFCRGWGHLPFDRSGTDLTAHGLAAMLDWQDRLQHGLRKKTSRCIRRGCAFLLKHQHAEGHWTPLWFGNENMPGQTNPMYGTARVLPVVARLAALNAKAAGGAVQRGLNWILSAQGKDGGWGGAPGMIPTIEETALAMDALAETASIQTSASLPADKARLTSALNQGTAWLVRATRSGRHLPASPIGFYFAKLWYFETAYPLVFTLSALEKAKRHL